jgi:hypothetical protein
MFLFLHLSWPPTHPPTSHTQTLCKRSAAATFSIHTLSPLLFARADRGDAVAIRRLLALVESLVSSRQQALQQQQQQQHGTSGSSTTGVHVAIDADYSCPPKLLGALAAAVEAAGNGDGARALREMQRSVQLARARRGPKTL